MEHCSMLQRVWDQLQEAGIAGNAVITAGGEQVELIKSQVQDAKIAVGPERYLCGSAGFLRLASQLRRSLCGGLRGHHAGGSLYGERLL